MAKPLLVLPNPFLSLDGDGNFAHACPCASKHVAGSAQYVGATRTINVQVASEKVTWQSAARPGQKPRMATAITPERSKAVYTFTTEPVELPDLPQYRKAIQSGDILAADVYTAQRAGIAFVEPREILARSRDIAAKQWAAEHGGEVPSWALNTKPDAALSATVN
jgi:hypothetical protein